MTRCNHRGTGLLMVDPFSSTLVPSLPSPEGMGHEQLWKAALVAPPYVQ